MPIIIIIAIIVILALVEWHTGILELVLLAKFSGSREKKVIGLSFDDGPDWGEEQLIAALNQARIRATFFWIWEKVGKLDSQNHQRFTQLLQLLKEGQHEVGIHALSCDVPSNPLRRILGFTRLADIAEAQDKLCHLPGYEPRLYRPHCVQLGRGLCDGIEGSGVIFVVGTLSCQIGNKKKNLGSKYLKTFKKVKPGDIICGHDSCDCHTDFGIARDIALVIPKLRDILDDKKLECRTLAEIINPSP